MTGTAASVYAKVVTTLGSRLRSRAMVTIAALLGVAGLVMWPVIAIVTLRARCEAHMGVRRLRRGGSASPTG